MSHPAISLLELNRQLKGVVQSSFSSALWVRAEIAELRENRNGHCYLDLVEKDERSDQVVARMRAMIWSYTYRMLKPYFETSTGRPLTNGIKVLVKGSLEFQEVYGLSFAIKDIDPTYTLGDLEQRRQEVLKRLKTEGVLEMNKGLSLPLVPQKIAIISSAGAAGYGDFIHQLENNAFGITFYHRLFPAVMQGEKAAQSIAEAFDRIFAYAGFFDLVVLIRGGGASLDLLCFDDYWLAYHITQFPLPVITGIGHDRDVSVADMVAHTSAKTPTAVAEFLISGASRVLEQVNSYSRNLKQITREKLLQHQNRLDRQSYQLVPRAQQLMAEKRHQLLNLGRRVPALTQGYLQGQAQLLKQFGGQIRQMPSRALTGEHQKLGRYIGQLKGQSISLLKHSKLHLEMLDKNNRLNDPSEVLKRGFTVTLRNGEVIKDVQLLNQGDLIETRFRMEK
ncbi:exodeoxyribonuclease VII large subunit [Geofilum rubicundum]|uniref:Exodeoxyribonuclease 7 large subunit n=1 Tax=Geofilum rubicundum JCM 15548 TaxID=1236989 RepID=A0A0E9LYN9_9BACT|nr:exodeoxyribonuclease VII large subunit [Geofilum rubicundum]GAO30359.1 exodeoxyribonuclease VII large subunit [Geofilum rubicundum JCM 15548]